MMLMKGRRADIKPNLRLSLLICALLLLLFTGQSAAQSEAGEDLQSLIDAAAPGSVVEVPPGVYAGPVVVDKAVHLRGLTGPNGERPIIDGGGVGTVVTITADRAVLEGFVVRNGGNVIDHEDSGVTVDKAEDVVVAHNWLEDVLYGVRGIEANRLVLQDNYITGKDLDIARRGDGIRLWQSENCLVENNVVEGVRDAIFWFSDGTTVRGNVFRHNRYGIHMMYTDGMTIQDNVASQNSVGVYLMYSINVLIEGNTFRHNRGPSGYGLALKDMDAVTVRENYFFENRVGLFFDNSPSRVDIEQEITRNVLAYNDIGVLMMPAVVRNHFRDNTFLDNLEQVGLKGGGSRQGDALGANTWDGNFWSDYVGYDADGDGRGDLPYVSESLFENLIDRYPSLRLLRFSPVEQAIETAARAFPVIKPKPKLTDAAPLMTPVLPAVLPRLEAHPNRLGWIAAALLALTLAVFALARFLNRSSGSPGPAEPVHLPEKDSAMIVISQLTKRYPQPGRAWWSDATITAVEDLSFQVAAGESLALWGVNGAGKTTVLKCILGLLDCEGELRLNGYDLRRDGRTARRFLGYVPQELAFYNDLTVADTCRFYARLKGVSTARISTVLAQVGLDGQERKEVGALSGGMKQRLALALAMLADPPVLLLDEPTSNLDLTARDEFIELLVRLRDAGKTLLFTSHHRDEVERLADRVLVLAEGRVVAEGAPAEVLQGAPITVQDRRDAAGSTRSLAPKASGPMRPAGSGLPSAVAFSVEESIP